MRVLSRFWKSERGAALVEFAIILPVLLIIIFAIIDFGRALYTLNNLTTAVRGARYAAVQQLNSFSTDSAATAAVVRSYVTNFGGSASGWNVIVTRTITSGVTQYLTVRIDGYSFVPITPMWTLLGLSAMSFSPSAVFRWERAS
jgi:Flp pilus assembly protein TadG